MADLADVEAALAALVANALYPNGTDQMSVTGVVYRIYRGYPTSPVLDVDLAAGVVHISIAPSDTEIRNVTRYPRKWQETSPVTEILTVVVNGSSATFSGMCAAGQLAGVIVDEETFPYAVQSSDHPPTVASNLAAQIRDAGWIVNYTGSTLTVPAASRFEARVVAGAGALQELRRQVKEFRISAWCPNPAMRDAVTQVINMALAAVKFMPLADGSYGRLIFSDIAAIDTSANASLYRQDLKYAVEYPTVLAQMTPAMLFGTVAASVNGVALRSFES